MSKCKKCCKEFKYQWCLDRHLRRKIPCKTVILCESENDPLPSEKNPSGNENAPLLSFIPPIYNENAPLINENVPSDFKHKCTYCEKQFLSKSNYNQHIKICKEKEDVIRSLEIQLDIPYTKSITHNSCRFCKKEFSKQSHCTRHLKICKAKQEYRESLEEKLELELKEKAKTNQTNVTNNHQTINNIMLNVSAETLRKFGEENTDHISNGTNYY